MLNGLVGLNRQIQHNQIVKDISIITYVEKARFLKNDYSRFSNEAAQKNVSIQFF